MAGYNLGLTAAEMVNDWPAFSSEGERGRGRRQENRAFCHTANGARDEIPRHFTKLDLLKRLCGATLKEHILANWEKWKRIRGLIPWISTLWVVCVHWV